MEGNFSLSRDSCNFQSGFWQIAWLNFSQAPDLSSTPIFTLPCKNLVLARIPLSQFNQNLSALHIWSGPSPSAIPQMMSDHPGPPSARILLGQFNQKPPTLMFPLSNFPSTDPHTAPWLWIPTCPRCVWSRAWSLSPAIKSHYDGPHSHGDGPE